MHAERSANCKKERLGKIGLHQPTRRTEHAREDVGMPPVQEVVQHIYCSAIISKKMCDVLTSYVFSVSAAKGGIDEFVVYLAPVGKI